MSKLMPNCLPPAHDNTCGIQLIEADGVACMGKLSWPSWLLEYLAIIHRLRAAKDLCYLSLSNLSMQIVYDL